MASIDIIDTQIYLFNGELLSGESGLSGKILKNEQRETFTLDAGGH